MKKLTPLKKKLDKIFSRFIRQRDKGRCFTCPKVDDWKHMQCGHFVPRQYLATRWDEENCHCQCYACNMLYNGQPSVFALKLGEKKVKELESKRRLVVKLDSAWYEERIAYYSALV